MLVRVFKVLAPQRFTFLSNLLNIDFAFHSSIVSFPHFTSIIIVWLIYKFECEAFVASFGPELMEDKEGQKLRILQEFHF